MFLWKILGATPSGKRLERIRQSANYRDGTFHNLHPTEITLKETSFVKMMIEFFTKPKNTTPASPVPSVRTDLKSLDSDVPTVIWLGHSSYLIRYRNTTVLVDPVLGGSASPFPFLVRSFPGSDIYTADDIPDIDITVITHDHYDHLDYKAIRALAPRTRVFCTSLGVGAHLEYWGVPGERIVELDWWEEMQAAEGIRLTALPARHFSGRTLKRNRTLWSSFALKLDKYNLFLGGDSGYDTHFADIGKKYGGFDIAVLEIGQYGRNWPYIHTVPEEAVRATADLGAGMLLPVHWGKFALALHEWNEPIQRAVSAARRQGVNITTPMIGEPVVLTRSYPAAQWWNV